jgi:hypothetical protein
MQEAFDWGQRKGNSYATKGEDAPASGAKFRMIEQSYSRGQQLVKDWLEVHADTGKKNGAVVVSDQVLVDLILYEVYSGRATEYLERPLTIRKLAARTPGWHVGPHRTVVRPPLGKGFIIANRPGLAGLSIQEIEATGAVIYRDYNSLPK